MLYYRLILMELGFLKIGIKIFVKDKKSRPRIPGHTRLDLDDSLLGTTVRSF